MRGNNESNGDRLASAISVVALRAVLGYALITGLSFSVVGKVSDTLKVFDVADEPPPPPEEEAAPADPTAQDSAASPPNLKAERSPLAAPAPAIILDVPPLLVTAPAPDLGSDASAGGSARPGPGTGSGGVGAGSGGGGDGAGRGGGGTRARQISGRIVDFDYPRTAKKARAEGSVLVRFLVGPDARACTGSFSSSRG
jgi:protein TonB